MRKIRAKGRMDANNSGWVGDLLAADCERDTLQKWKNWLHEMKKKDGVKKMEEEHQKKVSQMIKIADESGGLLHEITKPTVWRGELQILKEEEEDAKPSKDEDHGRCDKNDQTKRQNGPEWRLAVSESLAADCKKTWLHQEWEGGQNAAMVQVAT